MIVFFIIKQNPLAIILLSWHDFEKTWTFWGQNVGCHDALEFSWTLFKKALVSIPLKILRADMHTFLKELVERNC